MSISIFPPLSCASSTLPVSNWFKGKKKDKNVNNPDQHNHSAVRLKNKRPMGHITHWRNIYWQETSFIKAMIIQTGWSIVAVISPWKGTWPSIWTNLNFLHSMMYCANFQVWFPQNPQDFCSSHFLNLAQWFCRRCTKSEKFTDRQTDKGWNVINKALLSFQPRWAKKLLDFHSFLYLINFLCDKLHNQKHRIDF